MDYQMSQVFHRILSSRLVISFFIKTKFVFNRNRTRLSPFDFIGKDKPPFAHPPTSPVHPDYNGILSNIPNDLRSQMHQRVCLF